MKRFLKACLRLFLGVVCSLLVLAVTAYMFPRQVLTIDDGTQAKGDVIVVLGGGDGRAERAAELYRDHVAPHVLVTGYGDCASNVQTLEHEGVPASAITTEPSALSTLENAQFSLPLLRRMGAERVVLVTSWFHSRRALACFEHFAPDIIFFSRPSYLDYSPEHRNRASYAEHVNLEYLKLLGYWVDYGVCPL